MNPVDYRIQATPKIDDPGDGGAIPGRQGICSLNNDTAGAQTRTVLPPTNVGDVLSLWVVDVGGGLDVTFPEPIKVSGETTIEFQSTAGYAVLRAWPGTVSDPSPSWRLCCDDATQLS